MARARAAQLDPWLRAARAQVAQQLRDDLDFGVAASAPGLAEGAVSLYKQYDDPQAVFKGKMDASELKAWLEATSQPLVPHLDQCVPCPCPCSPHLGRACHVRPAAPMLPAALQLPMLGLHESGKCCNCRACRTAQGGGLRCCRAPRNARAVQAMFSNPSVRVVGIIPKVRAPVGS